MENTKICENTIENMKFELFTNNNEKCYQALKISTVGASSSTNRIAPVDFYTISTAIMCSKTLDEFIAAVNGVFVFGICRITSFRITEPSPEITIKNKC